MKIDGLLGIDVMIGLEMCSPAEQRQTKHTD